LTIVNKSDKEKLISLNLKDIPAGYSVKGIPEGLIKTGAHDKYDVDLEIIADKDSISARFIVELNDSGKTLDMQLGFIKLNTPESYGGKK
jgi:hypothetical protein